MFSMLLSSCIVSEPNSLESICISYTHNHLYTYIVLAITYLIKYTFSVSWYTDVRQLLVERKKKEKYLWKTYSRILCDAAVYL